MRENELCHCIELLVFIKNYATNNKHWIWLILIWNLFSVMGCFMSIMSSKGARIDPWGTSPFNVPKLEKQFWEVLVYFISTSCFLFVKLELNQSVLIPWISTCIKYLSWNRSDSPFLHILWTLRKLCHWGWSQCTKHREMRSAELVRGILTMQYDFRMCHAHTSEIKLVHLENTC